MPTSRFDRALLPGAKNFYESELGRIGRPARNGWAKADCVFHESKSHKSLNVNVETGAFHCFSCEASGGDLIDFVRLRYSYSFPEACQTLGCWAESLNQEAVRRMQQDRKRQERKRIDKLETARRERIDSREWLRAFESLYIEASERLSELRCGASEDFEDESEYCWHIMSEELPRIRQAETRYWTAAGLEVRHER